MRIPFIKTVSHSQKKYKLALNILKYSISLESTNEK